MCFEMDLIQTAAEEAIPFCPPLLDLLVTFEPIQPELRPQSTHVYTPIDRDNIGRLRLIVIKEGKFESHPPEKGRVGMSYSDYEGDSEVEEEEEVVQVEEKAVKDMVMFCKYG